MNIRTWTYVFTLGLQLAGALILIIQYLGKTRKRIISEVFPGSGIANNDGYDNAKIPVEQVHACVKKVYANRIAFVYIALGYAFSVFGDKKESNEWTLFCLVILIAIILIICEMGIAKLFSALFHNKEMLVSYEELPSYVSGTMSKKDMDDLIDGLYKK